MTHHEASQQCYFDVEVEDAAEHLHLHKIFFSLFFVLAVASSILTVNQFEPWGSRVLIKLNYIYGCRTRLLVTYTIYNLGEVYMFYKKEGF